MKSVIDTVNSNWLQIWLEDDASFPGKPIVYLVDGCHTSVIKVSCVGVKFITCPPSKLINLSMPGPNTPSTICTSDPYQSYPLVYCNSLLECHKDLYKIPNCQWRSLPCWPYSPSIINTVSAVILETKPGKHCYLVILHQHYVICVIQPVLHARIMYSVKQLILPHIKSYSLTSNQINTC